MKQDFDFFKTSMPSSRIADFYLGCLNGSVFIDFNLSKDLYIFIRRISFDGYGCCDLNEKVIPMTRDESLIFVGIYKNGILNQEIMTKLITKTIEINKEHIWQDALREYGFII